MSIRKDNKGFSLVEMLVVVAIIAIVSSISIRMVGYLRLANSEKTVQTISKMVTKQQALCMSKDEKPYLYIYKLGGEYYLTFSTVDCSGFSGSVMVNDGKPISSGNTVITMVDAAGSETEIKGDKFIKIAYKSDGLFNDAKTNCREIKVTSGSTTTIKLIMHTGKNIVE